MGPLSLRLGSSEATPSAKKERRILSLLLLNYSRVVPVSLMIDELWGAAPPKRALATVQTYILNIRKSLVRALRADSKTVYRDLLVTRSGGYLFNCASVVFDLQEYRKLESAGRKALDAGDDRAAVRSLRRADNLWDGPPLAGVELGLPLEVEVTRLNQSRLTAMELRIAAELRLGRHADILSELAALALQHPFHENIHAYLMVALYRSGRRTCALEVFQRLRSKMTAELGLEPSAKLRQLQEAILNSMEIDNEELSSPRLCSSR
ncbi:hypothetical protein GCM10012275_24610 [Longimycelium tulufanense]|uniref:OmpR/PhoB-type domain-containing protein n=1 Tax=Longimycelium tulufanense TaxID=907463 RepID=A0A8J3CCD2_9PSEU|nr:hypothetical protein GCM10012275_24610 [Longimycelium tulufanense]